MVPREKLEAYWKAIQDHVCFVCLDRKDDGSCGLPGGRVCALKWLLPHVVETIRSLNSPRMDEYFDAIQNNVCTRCPYQDWRGYCSYRERGECALSTYLSLVVDAIEDATPAGEAPAVKASEDTAAVSEGPGVKVPTAR